MRLIQIKTALRLLSLNQLKKLDEWLGELIRRAEEADRSEQSPSRNQTVKERTFDNKTYRLESIRCGKEICKCTRGKLHGPYWYSYTRVIDKVTSKYIGKSLPKDIEKKLKSLRGKSIS
jgi:transcriptional regulator CtsR